MRFWSKKRNFFLTCVYARIKIIPSKICNANWTAPWKNRISSTATKLRKSLVKPVRWQNISSCLVLPPDALMLFSERLPIYMSCMTIWNLPVLRRQGCWHSCCYCWRSCCSVHACTLHLFTPVTPTEVAEMVRALPDKQCLSDWPIANMDIKGERWHPGAIPEPTILLVTRARCCSVKDEGCAHNAGIEEDWFGPDRCIVISADLQPVQAAWKTGC